MRSIAYIALMLLSVTAQAAPAPSEQLKTTLQDLASSRETEVALKKRLAETEREMATIRERATDLAAQLQTSEQRVTNEENALAKANSDYAKKRDEFETRKADYTATILSLLRMRKLPPTAMLANPEDTETLMRTASVLEKTNHAVATKAMRLREDMAQIKSLRATAKARDASTRKEQEKLKIEREKLARELTHRQQLQAKLSADHARAEAKVAELSRSSQNLQELIAKLAEEEKSPLAPPKPTTKLREFSGKKGSLRNPVNGSILHRFGEKQDANGSYRGMVFKTRANATVVAPYDGRIVFTGPFRDYGKMVLIKHSNGYISLIAGLGKVNAGLNQAAVRGEPIGVMPESGSLEAYVELRDTDAKPIDPADWFANVVSQSAQP